MDGLILEGKDDGKSNKVHVRMQQRNGRKSWTTVAGFPEQVRLPKSGKVLQVDFEKILRTLKKTFKTNGVLIKDPDHGSVMQLQGDIRKEVAEFLIEVTAIITKDQVMSTAPEQFALCSSKSQLLVHAQWLERLSKPRK
eukprot:CAMPEP_0181428994 /NCGR_PEP_ID=MMETSP1110-20121109/16971_1 /TAXON_ID=174948 /ORGANISM="Symbiodinium sp., Strain CCMP421" /LENGTH=138 /DNA_ID=CAMNT_0023552249 /DNA_START=52 /DNA_END=466 /DNA_ORIENTATION=+